MFQFSDQATLHTPLALQTAVQLMKHGLPNASRLKHFDSDWTV
jgi:hypothetical protein